MKTITKTKQFAKDIWVFWLETWKTDKKLFFAEAVGTITSMYAAGLMSFQSPEPNLFIVFPFYIVGALCLFYSNYKRKSTWLMILMAYYAIVTSFGLTKLFI